MWVLNTTGLGYENAKLQFEAVMESGLPNSADDEIPILTPTLVWHLTPSEKKKYVAKRREYMDRLRQLRKKRVMRQTGMPANQMDDQNIGSRTDPPQFQHTVPVVIKFLSSISPEAGQSANLSKSTGDENGVRTTDGIWGLKERATYRRIQWPENEGFVLSPTSSGKRGSPSLEEEDPQKSDKRSKIDEKWSMYR